jgi:hypothetical protein
MLPVWSAMTAPPGGMETVIRLVAPVRRAPGVLHTYAGGGLRVPLADQQLCAASASHRVARVVWEWSDAPLLGDASRPYGLRGAQSIIRARKCGPGPGLVRSGGAGSDIWPAQLVDAAHQRHLEAFERRVVEDQVVAVAETRVAPGALVTG